MDKQARAGGIDRVLVFKALACPPAVYINQ